MIEKAIEVHFHDEYQCRANMSGSPKLLGVDMANPGDDYTVIFNGYRYNLDDNKREMLLSYFGSNRVKDDSHRTENPRYDETEDQNVKFTSIRDTLR